MWRWSIKKVFPSVSSYLRYNVLLNDPNLDRKSKNVFLLMNSVYFGFFISLIYGAFSSIIIYFLEKDTFKKYLYDFFVGYNCFITGGLLFGLAFQIYLTQGYIPNLLSNVFGKEKLSKNEIYSRHVKTFYSVTGSMRITTIHIILSFSLFYLAQFPYKSETVQSVMIIYGCALYGCGVYIGRKVFYVAQMLQSIEDIEFSEDIFSDNKLDGVSTYVNVVTTFTVLAIWFHVNSYYRGAFEYSTPLGEAIKIFMFYPAIIAMPVLIIFNYYPRSLIRKLYTKSINIKLSRLREELNLKTEISEFEKIQYLSEVDKISQDELKYKLRSAINDLPLVITIIIMLLSLMV